MIQQLVLPPASHQADTWSLAATIYEVLTLKKPFRANDLPELKEKVFSRAFELNRSSMTWQEFLLIASLHPSVTYHHLAEQQGSPQLRSIIGRLLVLDVGFSSLLFISFPFLICFPHFPRTTEQPAHELS